MRRSGETVDESSRDRLWTYVYYSELMARGSQRETFMAARPGAGNPATFAWLFAQQQTRDDRRQQWSFFMASLEEAAGDRNAARPRYEALRDELVRQRSAGAMLDETNAALKRLPSAAGAAPATPPR